LPPSRPGGTKQFPSISTEVIDMLEGIGQHDQVAQLRLERWLRSRGYESEADRVA
jgi:hypothetical protein